MNASEQWNEAQVAEARHWAGVGTEPYAILYELTEHYEELCKVLPGFLEGRQGLRGIEIGIGPLGIGFLSVYAGQQVSQVVGIESLSLQEVSLSDAALESYVRALRSRVAFVQGKGESLSYGDGAFDIAGCINVLDHTDRPAEILKEIARVTKPGGLFIFGVHTRSVLGQIRRAVKRRLRPDDPFYLAHPYSWRWPNVLGMLRGCGWSILWQNQPTLLQKLVGRAQMSCWILKRDA